MSRIRQFLVYSLGGQYYGLPLSAVEMVVHAAAVMPVPEAPETILGVINVEGNILLVINTRKYFHLQDRDMALSDQFIIAHTLTRGFALLVDGESRVIERTEEDVIKGKNILPDTDCVEGMVKFENSMAFICNPDAFLPREIEGRCRATDVTGAVL